MVAVLPAVKTVMEKCEMRLSNCLVKTTYLKKSGFEQKWISKSRVKELKDKIGEKRTHFLMEVVKKTLIEIVKKLCPLKFGSLTKSYKQY